MTLSELGKRVAAWRKRRHISQSEFCKAAGISRSTLSHLETGELLELGFGRVQRILNVVDKELAVRDVSPVPTFDELLRMNAEEREQEESLSGPGGPG